MKILPLSVMQVPGLSVTSDARVQCHMSFFPNTEGWKLDQWLLCIGNVLTHSDGAVLHPKKKHSRTAVDQRGSFSENAGHAEFCLFSKDPVTILWLDFLLGYKISPGHREQTLYFSLQGRCPCSICNKDIIFLHDQITWKKKYGSYSTLVFSAS